MSSPIITILQFKAQYHFPFADINIQPDPVKFVQLTTKYWEPFGEMRPGYLNLMYAPPEGCKLANVTADPDFAAEVCAPDSLDVNATAGKSEQIPSALFLREKRNL